MEENLSIKYIKKLYENNIIKFYFEIEPQYNINEFIENYENVISNYKKSILKKFDIKIELIENFIVFALSKRNCYNHVYDSGIVENFCKDLIYEFFNKNQILYKSNIEFDFNQSKSNKEYWLEFSFAKKFVHKLNLNNISEWMDACKNNLIPVDIPCLPYVYKEWNGWFDWLGKDYSGITCDQLLNIEPNRFNWLRTQHKINERKAKELYSKKVEIS